MAESYEAKNFVWKQIGNLLISVNDKEGGSEAEVESYLGHLKTLDIERTRCLCVSAGGGPNTAQRNRMNDLLKGRLLKTAVVSDAPVIRGIVTAMSWFNKDIKVFPTQAIEAAFRYLDVSPDRFEAIRREILMLQSTLRPERALPTKTGG